jgi:hypothetical protein
MNQFPRTMVGGVSLPRLVIGTNWFLGWSHTSLARDRFIKDYQTVERIRDVLCVFLERGIDAVLAPPSPHLEAAIQAAEDRSGRRMIRLLTPGFRIRPGDLADEEPGAAFDRCVELGAAFCLPHQCVTDVLVDRYNGQIRDIDQYTGMIREREMIPGLSTHLVETPVLADKCAADVETYIQIYNAAGFLMPVEADWAMRIIHDSQKPVIAIKPLAAGRLLPVVGLAFAWNTIRDQDMVAVGTTTPDEAREVIDISQDLLDRRVPGYELQRTRSKKFLDKR